MDDRDKSMGQNRATHGKRKRKDPSETSNSEQGGTSEEGQKRRKILISACSIALIVIAALAIGVLYPMLTSGGDSSKYVGEWYVPTDTDRRINLSANGDVTYGDDNHGTIAAGKWTVIDEDAGAIKFTLKAQEGNEKMFEEGVGEFTRMAYAESSEKLTAQMYYSSSEWETYIKK